MIVPVPHALEETLALVRVDRRLHDIGCINDVLVLLP